MYQKLILMGNLGGDPDMRYMPDGRAVTNFSLATNKKYKGDDGEWKSLTTWFRVSVWGKQAESCNQYLNRGSKVLIEGKLKGDSQTGGPRLFTRHDGTVGASFEVVADSVRFVDSRNDNTTQQVEEMTEDEIPF